MRAVLKTQINKTDRNDARGIAESCVLYRSVHVRTLRSQLRMLLTHRKLLHSKAIAVVNDLRDTLRNFGLKVGMVGTAKFEARIRELVEDFPTWRYWLNRCLLSAGYCATFFPACWTLQSLPRLGVRLRVCLLVSPLGRLHRLVVFDLFGQARAWSAVIVVYVLAEQSFEFLTVPFEKSGAAFVTAMKTNPTKFGGDVVAKLHVDRLATRGVICQVNQLIDAPMQVRPFQLADFLGELVKLPGSRRVSAVIRKQFGFLAAPVGRAFNLKADYFIDAEIEI